MKTGLPIGSLLYGTKLALFPQRKAKHRVFFHYLTTKASKRAS